MTTQPPSTVCAFFDQIRSLDAVSIANLPDHVDPRAYKPGTSCGPLRPSVRKTSELQEQYFEIQEPPDQLADESFDDLVAAYRSDELNGDTAGQSPEHRVVAIHLRSTDAVVFTGTSLQAWYGLPKVLRRSAPVWEE